MLFWSKITIHPCNEPFTRWNKWSTPEVTKEHLYVITRKTQQHHTLVFTVKPVLLSNRSISKDMYIFCHIKQWKVSHLIASTSNCWAVLLHHFLQNNQSIISTVDFWFSVSWLIGQLIVSAVEAWQVSLCCSSVSIGLFSLSVLIVFMINWPCLISKMSKDCEKGLSHFPKCFFC